MFYTLYSNILGLRVMFQVCQTKSIICVYRMVTGVCVCVCVFVSCESEIASGTTPLLSGRATRDSHRVRFYTCERGSPGKPADCLSMHHKNMFACLRVGNLVC